jgi:hypothetical protein
MTWRLKVQGVVFTVVMLGILALAGGASWIDGIVDWVDSFWS